MRARSTWRPGDSPVRVGGRCSVQFAGEVTVRGSQCRVHPASRREKTEGLARDTPKKGCQEIGEDPVLSEVRNGRAGKLKRKVFPQ